MPPPSWCLIPLKSQSLSVADKTAAFGRWAPPFISFLFFPPSIAFPDYCKTLESCAFMLPPLAFHFFGLPFELLFLLGHLWLTLAASRFRVSTAVTYLTISIGRRAQSKPTLLFVPSHRLLRVFLFSPPRRGFISFFIEGSNSPPTRLSFVILCLFSAPPLSGFPLFLTGPRRWIVGTIFELPLFPFGTSLSSPPFASLRHFFTIWLFFFATPSPLQLPFAFSLLDFLKHFEKYLGFRSPARLGFRF